MMPMMDNEEKQPLVTRQTVVILVTSFIAAFVFSMIRYGWFQ